jgi:hypothetical protein
MLLHRVLILTGKAGVRWFVRCEQGQTNNAMTVEHTSKEVGTPLMQSL